MATHFFILLWHLAVDNLDAVFKVRHLHDYSSSAGDIAGRNVLFL